MHSHLHRLAFLVGVPLLAAAAGHGRLRAQPGPADPASSAPSSQHAAAQTSGRVVVLGIDGGDFRTAKLLMEQGQLPNFSALAEQGTAGPLSTTNPAESPVSWASLNCGQNPAKTGVPGFVVRSFEDGQASPLPSIGFFGNEQRALEQVRGAPLPGWSAGMLAALCALATLVVFGVLFRFVLRVRALPASVLSGALAALAALGGYTLRGYLPEQYPVVTNRLETVPFWEEAASAGVRGVVLDAAQAWDRHDFEGCDVLAGLGVPDARGNYNGFTLYTTDEFVFARAPGPDSSTPSAGDRLRLEERGSKLVSKVYGPVDFWTAQRLKSELAKVQSSLDAAVSYNQSQKLESHKFALEEELGSVEDTPLSVPLEIEIAGGMARVSIGGVEQSLQAGQWSEFYSMTFELNPLVKVRALARAKVLSFEPNFQLYLDTLQIDPAHPPFWQPISHPAKFSRQLKRAAGPFETVGWACMNLPYKDGIVDPITFLEDIEFTYQWRRELTLDQIERDDWRLFFTCFSTPDRVQHMTYHYYDPQHPMYDAQAAAKTLRFFGEQIPLSDAIPAIYRAMDRLVGEIRAKLKPGDVLLICSDHGFQSFRKQVNLNNWLVENGYLTLKPGLSLGSGEFVPFFADLSATKAFAIGLGTIYLNIKGRDDGGIVDPAQAPALLAEISAKLLASRDVDGTSICLSAQPSSAIHQGPYLDREADLLVGFAPGYRVSWLTTTGGLALELKQDRTVAPSPSVVDNDKNWSGDHVSVDPSQVQGLFFSNVRLTAPPAGFDLRHVAPTVLKLLGVSVPKEYDLAPLQ